MAGCALECVCVTCVCHQCRVEAFRLLTAGLSAATHKAFLNKTVIMTSTISERADRVLSGCIFLLPIVCIAEL